jgi:hypothetical protein
MGQRAEMRWQRAHALMEKHPAVSPDVSGLGPEAPCSDHVINVLPVEK